MRLYVPLTLPRLALAHRQGELGPAPLTAFAVTPALRAWYVSDDLEELEYAALGRAALSSLRLLAAEPDAPRRRVVLAADVADRAVTWDDEDAGEGSGEAAGALGRVRATGAIALSKVAALHVDAEDAAVDVDAAARALSAADAGDEDARFTVEGADGHELLWYATQELDQLL
ncbi:MULTISPECIES: DUF6912 family protein [unclassified Streptomyces]|uniref:DUF6912 family protein n=1 Tax=unclassified Streptomyces TaxID=2593676 RepID=UPI0022B64CC3|nr:MULTISPECIES: hypothetical protein [unclassified Streptomyces]MCZ7414566.1 hypothetical protein [Streptomyces sp. WMMC897]MCZ7431493.1 hypothetical protein [Streptomyces sp. WMMC1477]